MVSKKYLDNFSDDMNTVLDGLIELKKSFPKSAISYSIGWMNAVMIYKGNLSKEQLELELQHAKGNLKQWREDLGVAA